MNEPRRLSEEGGSDFERSLLRSARHDGPSPAARRKTLLALGLAGSVGATVTATTATGAATTAVKSASALVFVKWIGAGVLGGLVALGAIEVVKPTPPATPAAAVTTAIAPRAPRPSPPPPPPPPAVAEEPAPPSPPPVVPPAVARPAPTSLTEEVASLDTARAALAGGDTSGALRALDEHHRRFPGGMLGPEATVLRIEALAARGDRAAAARLGTTFLDAHPRSPHASRLRSLLGLPIPAAPAAPSAVPAVPPLSAPR